MSEDAASYFFERCDTDYCATCGERLVVLPHGGRVACHPNEAQYWSSAKPLPKDAAGFYKICGQIPPVQTDWFEPTTGFHWHHVPLFLYRRAL